MSVLREIVPRPRSENPLPVDVAVALGLAGLGALDLQARAGLGPQPTASQALVLIGAALLGIYSATVPFGSASSIRGFVIAALALSLSVLTGPHPGLADLVAVSLPYAIFVLSRVQMSRQLSGRLAEERAATLERDQALRARQAVDEERARIARELHDVVAHSVGVMVVQAQGADRTMERDPEAARAALKVIAATGRDAVAEMQRMVTVLRSNSDGAGLTPQPGLAQLDALLEQTRRAGIPVAAAVEGVPRPLSPGVDLAAYRVVQEALTNVRKHAGIASAKVIVRYLDRSLDLEIQDDGKTEAKGQNEGHGLIGMKERVGLYGGTFRVGQSDSGGYTVFASLPLDGEL